MTTAYENDMVYDNRLNSVQVSGALFKSGRSDLRIISQVNDDRGSGDCAIESRSPGITYTVASSSFNQSSMTLTFTFSERPARALGTVLTRHRGPGTRSN